MPESPDKIRPEITQAVERAAEFAFERKATDVVALELATISGATDYFLLASGGSDVQVKAIAENIVQRLKEVEFRPEHIEGLQGGRWVLIDYVDFVIHVFHEEARSFYQLEDLWGDAPRREFDD
jgi:ribosome-associated protein